MAVSFATKPKKKATEEKAEAPAKKTGGLSFLKKGKEAKQALQHEEAKAQQAKEEKGKLWTFYIKEDDEKTITFLDGELDADGFLDVPMFYQHTVFHDGKWQDFVCTEDNEPCPLCAAGERSTLVGVLTCIDHSEHTIKNGPNKGEVIKDTKKLYVAKRGTLKLLQKQAEKRDGLTGATFEVSRTGDKSPNVGNMFEFVQKHSMAELQEHFGKDDKGNEVAEPADYEHEITYRPAEELLKLGLGKATQGIGSEKGIDKKELEEEL
jgi:hypothetical protein